LIFKTLYLTKRFYLLCAIFFVLFLSTFFYKPAFDFVLYAFFLFVATLIVDFILLYAVKKPVFANRTLPHIFSLNDPNPVGIELVNHTQLRFLFELIDELPLQFQIRDFLIKGSILQKEKKVLNYYPEPKSRGLYQFGHIQLYLKTKLGFCKRKISSGTPQSVSVFPSVIQMKKYQLLSMQKLSMFYGLKKIRRIGHSYDFDQIKEYALGDDVRCINWKATGRNAALMVNHYEEEKSQSVYCIIDKSRNMLMPFNGLSLMDYAINSSLVISNVAIHKADKAGLITFSDKMGATLIAENRAGHLRKIMNTLYNQKERETESNFELLYYSVQKMIKGRSLLMLYTNFESHSALMRRMPVLKQLNRSHLLVVVFFENTEIDAFSKENPGIDLEKIYTQTIAEQFLLDKKKIRQELLNYGIQSILTKPEELTINSLNKYLELKARGLI
jgi:uncharacterized protein (DUF58 family)